MNNLIDERSYQNGFYYEIFGEDWENIVHIGMSTDGYTDHVLFEHKINVYNYGISKTLGQALLYLVKFNREGIPVPGTIMLVSQEENKIYIYNSNDYNYIINNIEKYGQVSASKSIDIADMHSTIPARIIDYSLSSIGKKALRDEIEECNTCCKVNINVYNVVGWSKYYYDHAYDNGMKPTKEKFFNILRNPVGFMFSLINPWEGNEEEFCYVLDMLNDPAGQKQLGAFYTPDAYAKKAVEILRELIAEYKNKYPDDDYLIIDRCAGSGNLEINLTEEELSHCVLNTLEVKEWMALKNRIGRQIRVLIPDIPEDGSEPPHEGNILTGCNALSKEFCDKLKSIIKDCRKTERCAIFFLENPPYGENQAIQNQQYELHKNDDNFKKSYAFKVMKDHVEGVGLNDMLNVFIWSAFNMFMENDYDGAVFFGPIKYWKEQNVISKHFVNGILSNSEYYHAKSDFAISIIGWINENTNEDNLRLKVYDINKDGSLKFISNIIAKKAKNSMLSAYGDNREIENGINAITVDNNGLENTKFKPSLPPIINDNVIGYQVCGGFSIGNPGLDSQMVSGLHYKGHGDYLWKDNFITKLPMFIAGWYGGESKLWYYKQFLNKTGDGKSKFDAAIADHSADEWLIKCMIWTCFTQHNHMRSFVDSTGHSYTNQLCFLQDSIADNIISESEYKLNPTEKDLFERWNKILDFVKQTEEYNEEYRYGYYQVDQEINIKIPNGKISKDGKPEMINKYGDLKAMLDSFRIVLNRYYLDELTAKLFEYEFLK